MSRKLVAGNWKMNTTPKEGAKLAAEIAALKTDQTCELVVIPPFTHLQRVSEAIRGTGIKLGAQNCHEAKSGAFTGEVSAAMLKDLGVDYVVIGHSERRQYFGESHSLLAAKINSVLEYGMDVIFCCGETLDDRNSGMHFDIVWKQISDSLFHLSEEQFARVVIAYEPVWAIGTGKTASDDEAQEMHAHIRKMIIDRYSSGTANSTAILYGGSVKKENAKDLFAQQDIDGGLIGGASLDATGFVAIGNSFG